MNREDKKRECLLELIGELPYAIGIKIGDSTECNSADPNVGESFRVGMRHAWVASISISEVLLHAPPTSIGPVDYPFASAEVDF